MGKLIGSEVEEVRAFEPDNPAKRNPWDPQRHPKQYAYVESLIKQIDADDIRPPKYSNEIKLEVYRLRDAGLTLREIAAKAKISKSTACLYLQKRKPQSAVIKQPGTSKTVETTYSISEVNLGIISVKK